MNKFEQMQALDAQIVKRQEDIELMLKRITDIK